MHDYVAGGSCRSQRKNRGNVKVPQIPFGVSMKVRKRSAVMVSPTKRDTSPTSCRGVEQSRKNHHCIL